MKMLSMLLSVPALMLVAAPAPAARIAPPAKTAPSPAPVKDEPWAGRELVAYGLLGAAVYTAARRTRRRGRDAGTGS
jgi:hypothetical protein